MDEGVTSLGNGPDVARPAVIVGQDAARFLNTPGQGIVSHFDVRPDPVEERLTVHQMRRPLEHEDENAERLGAKMKFFGSPRQALLSRIDKEISEAITERITNHRVTS